MTMIRTKVWYSHTARSCSLSLHGMWGCLVLYANPQTGPGMVERCAFLSLALFDLQSFYHLRNCAGPKLGLGDFIFYRYVTLRVSSRYPGIIACFFLADCSHEHMLYCCVLISSPVACGMTHMRTPLTVFSWGKRRRKLRLACR